MYNTFWAPESGMKDSRGQAESIEPPNVGKIQYIISAPSLKSVNRSEFLEIEKLQKDTISISTRARRSLVASRRLRAESFGPLSRILKNIVGYERCLISQIEHLKKGGHG